MRKCDETSRFPKRKWTVIFLIWAVVWDVPEDLKRRAKKVLAPRKRYED